MNHPAPAAERPLRILQLSTADVRGGAEQVAWNLFSAYRARGHASWLAVGERLTDDPDVWTVPNDEARGAWTRSWRALADLLESPAGTSRAVALLRRVAGAVAEPARRLDYYRGREDFDFPATRRLLTMLPDRPHVVHAHNLHGGYFDLRALPWLSREVPLVLTLHDAWLLSGHCAHSFECDRWRTGCGACPDLSIYPAVWRDATAYNWRRKREIFGRSSLYVATPSRWLMRKVEQSMLAPAVGEARVIPNGVDLSVFRPGDRRPARAALGLPLEAPVLLTTARELFNNCWKDLPTLREAVARLAEEWVGPRIHVVVLGTSGPTQSVGRAEMRFVPYQRDPVAVAMHYQAADVYVHATRADTFPIAVLEALACGIPAVASAVGGIPEQVEDGQCGFLVPPGDARALAARVHRVLADERVRASLGEEGARQARRRFDFQEQVRAHLDWYSELVDGTARRSAA